MSNTAEQLWNKVNTAVDVGSYDSAYDLLQQLVQMGDEDAVPMLILISSMYALKIQNETIDLQGAAKVRGQTAAAKMLYASIRAALEYQMMCPQRRNDCFYMGQTIVNSFGALYMMAANGTGYGYRVIRDGERLKDVTASWAGNTLYIFEEWEKYHEDYVSTIPMDANVFSYADSRDSSIWKAIQEVIANARDVAQQLDMEGRAYEAQMLRARMALESADNQNGKRENLLTAEWFYTAAVNSAREAFGETEAFNEWKEAQTQTIDKYFQMTAQYRRLIASYKQSGIQPNLKYFYKKNTAVPQVSSNRSYETPEDIEKLKAIEKKAGIKDTTYSSSNGTFQRLLSVISKISIKEYMFVILFSAISGFFGGGLIPLLADWGTEVPLLIGLNIILCIVISLITFRRSMEASDHQQYGSDSLLYIGFMIAMVVMLHLHYILGIIIFIVLKILSNVL